jgi:arginyl-tRNA synthetase
MQSEIQLLVQRALDVFLVDQKQEQIEYNIQIDTCKDVKHGDFSCNIAMILAKKLRMNPVQVAKNILSLLADSDLIASADIAGPGFINFRLTDSAVHTAVADVLHKQNSYGYSKIGAKQRVHIEFVSANPTGPLHVGHGRGAAFGSVIVNLLRATDHEVHAEYYVNDAGRQISILGLSVLLRYWQQLGLRVDFFEGLYQGDYIKDIAAQMHASFDEKWRISAAQTEELGSELSIIDDKDKRIDSAISLVSAMISDSEFKVVAAYATDAILSDIKNDLAGFGVNYNEWFKESSLIDAGLLEKGLQKLRDGGYVYEKNGALWFKASDLGDEKDRVLVRENGLPTYFASDVAYHLHKYDAGFDKIIDVFGSDHHGYIPRIRAFLEGLGKDASKLEVLLVQFAVLYRGQEKVSMSTRSGDFVTLRNLREEVGVDAARFFYIMRKAEQHLDFDLELAKDQTQDNPVYYIQYAHARICSVWRQLAEKNIVFDQACGLQSLERLLSDKERALMMQLSKYPRVIEVAATRCEPHLLAAYLQDLAAQFQSYYNAERFIIDDVDLMQARLCLVKSVQITIANGLKILGMSAPEKM